MKKKVVRIAIVLLVVAMALSLGACKEDPPPPPAPTQSSPANSPSPSQPPAPPPAQSPSPSPEPVYSDYGLLEIVERYYLNGDDDAAYCIFFSDDTIQDEYGEEGEFDVFGNYINIFYNGEHVATLEILDSYTLEDVETGTLWIRDGGYIPQPTGPSYVSAGLPPIIFNKYFYLDGDTDETSLYFWEDGDVDIESPNGNIYADYVWTGNEIVIMREGQVILVLSIDNPTELEDVNSWDSYYFEDAHTYELETSERYYLNGDEDELQLWFWSDGTVEIENTNGDVNTADYYTIGYTVYIDIGYEVELEIVNSYVLRDNEDGEMFIRLP